MEIYQPSDDSLLFADFLKKYFKSHPSKNIKCLDIGTGSGILAKTVSHFISPESVTALDINPDAVKSLKKEKFKVIQSDLFEVFDKPSFGRPSPYKSQIPNPKSHTIKFDLIVFNAPYLPLDKREPASSRVATTGGKRGDEVSLKFLRQAKKHLAENGKIFLLVSSLTPLDKIKKLWDYKIVARKKLFMEELLILEFNS